MATKGALQKILKVMIHKEEEDKGDCENNGKKEFP
jgi:hypothetical protein